MRNNPFVTICILLDGGIYQQYAAMDLIKKELLGPCPPHKLNRYKELFRFFYTDNSILLEHKHEIQDIIVSLEEKHGIH
ncbi:MAG: hypothetical protein R3321_05735 [Nitrososphaeraceae archaeon]|nr:hypothetical protein [Nitrososphaeraceae archaeon]